jgi:hypothetical protein
MSVLLSRKFVRNYGLSLLGLLLIAAFSGCAPTMSSVSDTGPAVSPLRPETVLKKISRPDRNILKTMANIEVRQGSRRYSTKTALIMKRPSFVRIEAIPIIGPVNFFLSIHQDVLKIFLPQKRTFYIGKATPENLVNIVDFFPAGLRVEDFLSIMHGTYPHVMAKNVMLTGYWDGKQYRIDMMTEEGGRLQSLWVDVSNYRLVQVQVFKERDRVAYTAKFEEFDISTELPPLKITIRSEGDAHSEVIVRYSDIQFVTDTETSTFDLQAPPGIEPVYLDQTKNP